MRKDKKVALLSALFGASAVVISCGGGGGGGTTTTTTETNATSENQTQEVQRAEVTGNVPAGLIVDNQTADITPDKAFRADGEVVTDVWAVVGNETYGGHFENRNGTWVFVIDEPIPANESFSIMFVNGTPDTPDNQTVVAVTPPVVVNAANADLKLTDVQDGVVNVDTADSVGVGQVVDNATVIEQIKQAVGKKVTEAKQIIANATQQVTEQIQQQQQQNATNATQEVTLKDGWYKNYAVGLYEKQVSTELKYEDSSIPAKKIAVAEKDETFYVLVDKDGKGAYDVLYKVDSKGALSKVEDIANSTSGNVTKVVGNYIVLKDDTLNQYSFVKLDDFETVNATLKDNLYDEVDNVYWGLKAKDNSTIVRFDFNKGDAVLRKTYTSSINNYNDTLIQVKAASADTAWILLPSNSTSNSTVARVYLDGSELKSNPADIDNTTNATVADFGVVSDNVAWAVLDNATANATIARIAWDGTNLTQNAKTVSANNATFVAIEPVDENVAWAVVSNATKSVVARVEYTDSGLNVSENATINGVNATKAKIVAVDKNNAWIVLSNATATYVAKAKYTDSGNVEVYSNSTTFKNATNISAKAVEQGDVLWIALDNGTDNAVVRAEFDDNNNNVKLVANATIKTGNKRNIIHTLTILETIPGKDENYVILGDTKGNATNTVVVYYDNENNALKTYPVDEGVQTIHSAVYVNGYTQILVNDDYNGGQLKVLTFDADNQRWTTEDSLDTDKKFSSLKKVDSTTFLGVAGSNTYLIKYENKEIKVSKEDVPCSVNVGQQICVKPKNKQEEIYYLTYDNIDQWGNLALQVKEDASNSTADVKSVILNDTIYTFTPGGNKLDLIQIGAENKEDAVVVNKYEFNNDLDEVVVLPNKNLVAAIDNNGDVIIAPVTGKGAKTVSNLDVGRIATDGEFVYAITTDTLYKIDTDKAEVVNGVGTKVTDNVFTDLKDIAVVNNAIAVVGVSTGGKLGVRFINPADTSALSDWITVCDYDSNKGIYLSVKGNYLIIDHNGEAYIVDVNDRTNPQLLNATINGVDKLSVFGNIGYGMTADNKIAKIDLSNITNATIVNNATIDNYTTLVLSNVKLYAYGDYVFANDGGQRVEIYNLAGVTNNSTTVKYMGDAEVDKTISSFTVKLVNGTYYLIVTDGKRLDILKLNPKEVQ